MAEEVLFNQMKFGIMQGRLFSQKKFGDNKISINSIYEFILLKNLDFDYIEIIVDRNLFFLKLINNYKISKIKNKIYSINIDYFVENNFFTDLIFNKELLEKIIKFSIKMGVKVIVIPCIENNALNERQMATLIKILEKKIKNRNIQISLEVNKITKTIKEKLKSKKIGICYDTGNLGSNSFSFLKKHFFKINHIHVKDVNINMKSCMLGDGIINFKKIFNFLKEKKYNKNITLETFFISKKNLINAISNIAFIKKLI